MTTTVHRNFKQVADAESARSALLAGGFSASSVTLNAHTIGDSPDLVAGAVESIIDQLTPGGEGAAVRARHQEGALLSVDTDDDDQRQQADAIMQRFGAVEA
ncbi:hypothetical protein [Rugamonas sp.]|uniref:hypothetical protein n=1 Tax=Rugamonas sp. TaxID=1926287 RepID=UPI0025F32712|nr:hypothetical protein [Rugamonas sp.]